MTDGLTAENHGKLTFLQNKEINLGLAHGLSAEQIRLYACPQFNYLQMEQIRLGLEHGLDPELIAVFAVPGKKQDQMKEERERLEQGLPVLPDNLVSNGPGWKTAAVCTAVLAVSALLSAVLAYSAHRRMEMLLNPLNLHLTADQVQLETGSIFRPREYLGEYDADAVLTLPQPPDTAKAGTHVLAYTLQKDRRMTRRTLVLNIVEPKPVPPAPAAVPETEDPESSSPPEQTMNSAILSKPPAAPAAAAENPAAADFETAEPLEYTEEIYSADSWQEVGLGEVEVTHDWDG